MFSRAPLPRRGDLLLHSRQRDLVRDVWAARAIQGEGGIQTDITGAGAFLTQPRAPVMGLFEIVDKTCTWRWEERSSSNWPDRYHYTIGRPIFYYYADGIWGPPTPAMDPDGSSSSSGILEQYIVHPTGYPELIREQMRVYDAFFPLYSVGDWVWCIYEPRSGHWAIHDGYESFLRFELINNLATGSYASAYLLQCQQCPTSSMPHSADNFDQHYAPNTSFSFHVYDGICGWEGTIGQRGYCKWFADSRRFEVMALSSRVFWRFQLAEALDQWATEPVLAYRRTWDPEANNGYGAYTTDTGTTFYIADWSEIGYFGYASQGATGVAELHESENGHVGVINDLRCPPECPCNPTASSSSSGA